MNREPTNSDILQMMGEIRQEVRDVAKTGQEERAKIYAQTAKTNGRVTKIEQWINDYKIRRDERSKIKDEQSMVRSAENVNITARLSGAKEKVFLALAGLLTAITAYIALKGGV